MSVERGPNLNLLDYVEPVRDSPLYTAWRLPIPPEWYSANRRAYTLVDQEALYGSLLYSRSYGRTGTDSLGAATDTSAITATSKERSAGESLFDVVEAVTTVRTFIVTASDSVPNGTESLRSIRNQGALAQPIIHTWP